MSANDALKAYQNDTLKGAELSTLRAFLHEVNQQVLYDARIFKPVATAIQNLITERENEIRHNAVTKQAIDHHAQIKGPLEEVQGHTSKAVQQLAQANEQIVALKNQNAEFKAILKGIHRVDFWILVVAVLTLFAAIIAAADVFVKWFASSPAVAVSETGQPKPVHGTNK